MKLYTDTIAYTQLKSFLKSSYEMNLDTNNEIRQNIVEYYINEFDKNPQKVKNNTMKRIDEYFEADSLDKKIIVRKLDRIIKEISNNID